MPRNTKSEIWHYFEYVNADSARCNKCCRFYSRKGRTTTSLKNHLRSAHPQEYLEFLNMDMVRLQNKSKHPDGCNENSLNETNTTLESKESSCIDLVSLSTVDIKKEVLQATNVPEITAENTKTNETEINVHRNFDGQENDISSLKTRTLEIHHEAHSDDSSEAPTAANNDDEFVKPALNNNVDFGKPAVNNVEIVEPIAKKIKVGANDPLNEPTLSTKKRVNNCSTFRIDPLRDSYASSPKDEDLERALRKRKLLLEIEQLQIQNYEMKLKLWEKEQQLQMPSSRFTREISARKRAAEEEIFENF